MSKQGSIGYREFMARLGVTREAHRLMVAEGAMPAPPKVPGSPLINWTPDYLSACEKALEARRRARVRGLRRRVRTIAAQGRGPTT